MTEPPDPGPRPAPDQLPASSAGRTLEVLIVSVEDDAPQQRGGFHPGEFRGILEMPEQQLVEEITKLRGEWNRLL